MNLDFNEAELRRVDLNLLPIFAALMRERSVKGAAGRLGLSSPAVSMALGRLRLMIDDPLLVRGRDGLEPTTRALRLADQIAPCLHAAREALLGRDRFVPALAEGVLRFASPDDLENYLVPQLVERLSREAPGLSLAVRPADYVVVPAMLDDGEVDLALTATPPGLNRRHRHKVVQTAECFLALFDPEFIDGWNGEALTLDQYLSVPHLLRSPAGDFNGVLDVALAAVGRTRRVSVSVARFTVMPYLLKCAAFIANVPATTARLFAKEYGLTVSPLPIDAQPRFDVSLVWHLRADADPALAWLRDVVTQELQRISR